MHKIRYADIDDSNMLGEIHSQSWKVAYKGIVPDEILNVGEKLKIDISKNQIEESIQILKSRIQDFTQMRG